MTRTSNRTNAVQGVEFFYQCEAAGTPLPSFVFYKVHWMTLLVGLQSRSVSTQMYLICWNFGMSKITAYAIVLNLFTVPNPFEIFY